MESSLLWESLLNSSHRYNIGGREETAAAQIEDHIQRYVCTTYNIEPQTRPYKPTAVVGGRR